MNKFQFMGRLTKDPEKRVTQNNTPVSVFTIAVNRRFTGTNGKRETDFFNVTAFGKLAEFCFKYYKKGQQVLVEGRIQNRTWEEQTGTKRYATDYIVENVYFADSRKNAESSIDMEIPTESSEGDFNTINDTAKLPF